MSAVSAGPRSRDLAGTEIPTLVFDTSGEASRHVALVIESLIRQSNQAGRATVLGLATGSTPVGLYRELIRLHKEAGLDFSRVVTFNLDEYYPIAPTDPRWISTLDAITDELVSDSLVYRYNVEASPDGLVGDEATFSLCSFWWVEALARAGRLEEARLAFEKMLTYANHVGLYSEEIGPTGEQLGNFPQAFTHLALISAAVNLDRQLG